MNTPLLQMSPSDLETLGIFGIILFLILALYAVFLFVWPLAIYSLCSQILKEIKQLRSEAEEHAYLRMKE